MIEFVDLRQSGLGNCFAFWNTVSDMFMRFSGSQTWDNKRDFVEDYESSGPHPSNHPLDRYTGKIPDWVPREYVYEDETYE